MPSYEQKTAEFAGGKRLVRLSRPVRDRADSSCDACGSTEPRTLYGLREEDSGRYYFVGKECLKELVLSGAILRRYGRTSAQKEYEQEMRLRAQENSTEAGQGDIDTRAGSSEVQNRHSDRPEPPEGTLPAVIVIEFPESWIALACVATPRGVTWSKGDAVETADQIVWRRVGDAMLLERVRQNGAEALRTAVTRAWQQASARLTHPEESQPLVAEDAGGSNGSLPEPLVARLEVVSAAPGVFDAAPNGENGNSGVLEHHGPDS